MELHAKNSGPFNNDATQLRTKLFGQDEITFTHPKALLKAALMQFFASFVNRRGAGDIVQIVCAGTLEQ